VESVYKHFRLPKEKYRTLKARALHPLKARRYEELHALEDVSFEIPQGEFFGIVGRNGSGKSTLLKCLAGIYQTDSGRIRIEGRLSPFIELGVGFHPELTARDNVIINAIMLGLTKREAERRFDAIIEFAELEEFVDLPLKNYSSGMGVRLGFAVAVEVDADVLLIDEVLAVGDASFQQKCADQFDKLKANGRTIVLVTHDMSAIERFCDRALLIERGRTLEIGEPHGISRRYLEVNFDLPPAPPPAGGALIAGAWCERADGTRVGAIAQGNLCTACMEVEFERAMRAPEFAIALMNDAGQVALGLQSEGHANATEAFAPGDRAIIHFRFEPWLGPGLYRLSASIGEADAVIAFSDDLATLEVDGPESGALVELPHEAEIKRL